MARPRKVKFPVAFEEWLRFTLPKKRPEDRMKIFRECCRTNLRAKFNREPTDQELEEEIKLIRERKFDVSNYTLVFGECLKDFVPVLAKENRRKKAQIAAAKRWSKKSEKKPLT